MIGRILVSDKMNPGVDFVCILPGIQQAVGVIGALWSIAQLVGNVGNRIFKELVHFVSFPTIESFAEHNKFREQNNLERGEHEYNLVLNILRCIPVLGSVISGWRFGIGAALGASQMHRC